MDYELPGSFMDLAREYPDLGNAFKDLGDQCHRSGPLEEKTRRLVKLAIAVGTGSEGGVHSAVRNALRSGVSKEEIMHVGILAITTIGIPHAMAAITWIKDMIEKP